MVHQLLENRSSQAGSIRKEYEGKRIKENFPVFCAELPGELPFTSACRPFLLGFLLGPQRASLGIPVRKV